MTSGMERRRRRAGERRQRILTAAARVFSQKGYEGATTREIAAEADVAEGTIYNYFEGKSDLLMGIVAEIAPGLLNEELNLPEGKDLEARLVSSLEGMLARVSEHRDMLSVMAGELWRNEAVLHDWMVDALQWLLARLEEWLAKLIRAGELRSFDLQLGARMIFFAGAGIVMPIVTGVWEVPSADRRRQMATELAGLLLHGLKARR